MKGFKYLLFTLTLLMTFITAQCNPDKAQHFALEPFSKSAKIGDTVVFPCRVENKRGTLQWTRDGFGLGSDRKLPGFDRYQMVGSEEEGDFSLQITNVELEDDAQFQCQVGASEGIKGIRSKSAVLTVFVPPEKPKIVQGDFLKTTAGTTVELTCEAHGGKPPAELTWLDPDGNPVSAGVEYRTELLPDQKRGNAFLKWTFKPTKEHHNKQFTCRSENAALTQQEKAYIRVEVKYPPEIKLVTNKTRIKEGDNVEFRCDASANPSEIDYRWFKNKELVPGDLTNVFTINHISREYNNAEIACEVTNSVGKTKATHKLNIHYGPKFQTTMKTVVASEIGEEVVLNCDVDGNPKPKIIWLLDGSPNVLSTNMKLKIADMSYEKMGTYTCRASVEGFPEVSASSLVFIKGRPRVQSTPIQYGTEEELVKIECLVQSIPPPTKIQWFRDSKMLENDDKHGIKIVEETLPGDSLIRNILVIHKARKDDFGLYNCSVWNEFGHDYMMITLNRQRTFPMLIIVAAIIGSVVAVVSITIIIILCMKRKTNLDVDYGHDFKKDTNSITNTNSTSEKQSHFNHHYHQPQQQQQLPNHLHLHPHHLETGSSGADSDLKVEIRTTSSISDQGQSWDDVNEVTNERTVTACEIAQVVENIYNYTAEPVYQSKENQNNNGYLPYTDYSRDFSTLPASMTSMQQQTQQQQQQQQQQGLQHASIVMTSNRDSYIDSHYGSLSIDARYRANYSSPYARATSTLNHSPVTPTTTNILSTGIYNTNPMYITSPNANQQVKTGTLATHV